MARPLYKLSAVGVKSAQPGKYADGGGLWFHKRPDGGGQWFLRYTIHGRRREMGLGSSSEVTLKDARIAADKYRTILRDLRDPIKERDRERREALKNIHLLRDIANDAFESRKAELKGDGANGRWFSPLENHILPRLGSVPVSEIDQKDIRDTLLPIWHSKAETAKKALDRLRICLRHAAALGLTVDLQAPEKARALLGKQRHQAKNIPAIPWKDVPAFYSSLNLGTATHLALKLLILTGVRSGPLRHLHESQISDDIWTISPEQMKGRVDATGEFRVPLSKEALKVIAEARKMSREGYLFPGVKSGVISDMTMSKMMRTAKTGALPHGFRSSLRDWLADATDAKHEVAETILGHVVGGSVERSYRRTDYLEQRRVLMERWGQHVAGGSGKLLMMVGGQ